MKYVSEHTWLITFTSSLPLKWTCLSLHVVCVFIFFPSHKQWLIYKITHIYCVISVCEQECGGHVTPSQGYLSCCTEFPEFSSFFPPLAFCLTHISLFLSSVLQRGPLSEMQTWRGRHTRTHAHTHIHKGTLTYAARGMFVGKTYLVWFLEFEPSVYMWVCVHVCLCRNKYVRS